MGLFGGNNELIENRLKQCTLYLDNLESELLTLHLSFLEKERYMMGLTTAEEYKMILGQMTNSKWSRLKHINQLHDEENKEEQTNEH